MDVKNPEILASVFNYRDFLIKETLLMQEQQSEINVDIFPPQPYILTVVNCADVALSVFCTHVLTRCWIFCSNELLCLSVERCVLLRYSNLERW